MKELLPANLTEFLQGMLPEREQIYQELEEECRAEFIPLIEPEVGQFLQAIITLKKPRRILEIGTAIGYSTLWLAHAPCNCLEGITTIEIDAARHQRACANFRKAGLDKLITALQGDANEVLPRLRGTYDLVFVDAAKGQYLEFFHKAWPLLAPDGTIVIDNVFLNGWVIDMYWPERRKKTMVCRVRELLEMLKNHPQLVTTLVPLGDGLALCVRREL